MSDAQTRDAGFVEGLDRSRHLALDRRRLELWIPRVVLILLAAFAVAALLNAFGQGTTISRASSPVATVEVKSPSHLRTGLLFETRITITAHRAIPQPRIVFSQGWLEDMTLNEIEPNPQDEGTRHGDLSLSYNGMSAGDRLVVWLAWQVNPPYATHRNLVVELDNRASPIVRIHRSLTVFP